MLSYEIKGKGRPVVLLHSFPLSARMWEGQAELFATDYQIICPDFPGFGKLPVLQNISIAAMAREVAVLLEHLKITEPVFLGGLSMGGYAAFEFLRQFPDKVMALGFFATRATPDSPTNMWYASSVSMNLVVRARGSNADSAKAAS